MKSTVSVIIIAHNEEAYIGKCLTSVLRQRTKPLEILVVAHNCTDRTIEIARHFPGVTVLEYSGPSGIAHARSYGFAHAKGDLVVSLDGDSYALGNRWLGSLIKPFARKRTVLVGGPVWFTDLYGWFMSLNFFYLKPLFSRNFKFYPWGSNLAFRNEAYHQVKGLKPLIDNCVKWQLTYWADDYYLYKQLSSLGKTKFVSNAAIASHPPKMTIQEWQKRSRRQGADKAKLDKILG